MPKVKPKQQIKRSFYLPLALTKRLAVEAARQGMSRSAMVTEALAGYFNREKTNGEKQING
jgi:ribbon-helix-helix CopG family protein